MTRYVLLAAAILSVVMPVAAIADPVLLTYSYARFFNLPEDNSTYACSVEFGPCSGSALAPNTNWTVNYDSDAAADFGILKARAALTLTGDGSLGPLDGGNVPFPSLVSVGARAGFQDDYTVFGGAGNGTMIFHFDVDGFGDASAGATGRASLQTIPVQGGVLQWNQQRNFGVVNGAATVPIDIVFGQPIEYVVFFYGLAQIFTANGWTEGAYANADFFSTAVLDGITVTGSDGQALNSFQISASSNTVYGPDGVTAVPEPATLLMLGGGLLGLMSWRRLAK